MKISFTFYMVHNVETLIFANFIISENGKSNIWRS